jgi:Tfp pilus assembly PilM family ATPase
MGLIQVSCNPFKEKKLKDINLGEIAKEVLVSHEDRLRPFMVSLEGIKRELEYSQDWKKMSKDEGPNYAGVGFKSSDLDAFYKDTIFVERNGELVKTEINDEIRKYMDMTYEKMNGEERDVLRKYKVPALELIYRNSGGHPSITNIQGFNFLKYDLDNLRKNYGVEKYTEVMKKVARDFINNLKDKIQKYKQGSEIEYMNTGIELKGHDTNE